MLSFRHLHHCHGVLQLAAHTRRIAVPLFALLTFIFAPIVRQQARTKAERNAENQSYLVEVVSEFKR